MAAHSSVLAWRIPGMGEPGGLPSMGSHRVGNDWSDLAWTFEGSILKLPDLEETTKSNVIHTISHSLEFQESFSGGSDSKESVCNAGDPGSIAGSERSLREGNGNPLQYSYLVNPIDREAWRATVHGLQRVRHDWATNTLTFFNIARIKETENNKVLTRLWRNWKLHTLMARMQNGAVTAESSLEVPQMVKHTVTLALIDSVLDTQDN